MSYYILAVDRDSDGLEFITGNEYMDVWLFFTKEELDAGIAGAIRYLKDQLEFGQNYSDIDSMLNVFECVDSIGNVNTEDYIKNIRKSIEDEQKQKDQRRKLYLELQQEFG
jgi:hypothetical protein